MMRLLQCAWLVALVGTALFVGQRQAAGDDFPKPYDSETDLSQPRLDPQDAATKFRVPEGFHVGVFAAEPDVANPIATTWDTRGRLWVAENYTYAERPKRFDLGLRNRVLIFTDKDGDGRFDERRVFLENAQRLTSIEVGLGGVWLLCPPQLLFVPDRDGDDRPDGPAETVLEGFTLPPENFHNFANGLRWGPDGWLYGRCGASAPGLVQRADAPEAYRVPLRGGMWRYHPRTKQFDALCHGTTNPWGHDWDRHGEGFFINTVNGHLWHIIAGAHYRRPHTIASSPLVYEPVEMHADHWHWDTGKDWADSRKASGEHDRRGGGHAHVGMTIYGGQQWPEAYRGRLFTLNQHGRRMNVERLEREGSGYVGRHDPDILQSADAWFRGVEVTYGPDGSVYLIDWSDTGECHENTGVHRSSGRIYRVTYGGPASKAAPDLRSATQKELVAMHSDANEWIARAARRELCDRTTSGADVQPAATELRKLLASGSDEVSRLRTMWTLFALDKLPADELKALLRDKSEHVRTWSVRLLTDNMPLDLATGVSRAANAPIDSALLTEFLRMAREDSSGLVRLALASTLQRLPLADRPKLAAALLSRSEDADDHNIPAVIWYGLIPLAEREPQTLIPLAIEGRIPAVRVWTARRSAELAIKQPALLATLFEQGTSKPLALQADLAAGVVTRTGGASQGGDAGKLAEVPGVGGESSTETQEQLRTIGVVFGDGRALDEVRRLALDDKADLAQRRLALLSLIEAQPDDLREVCDKLLKVRFLNTTAMQGLARFNDPEIGKKLARSFKNFHHSERAAVVETLASRPVFAAELLDQMAAGVIARGDVSAAQARQIRGFNDPALTKRLGEVWGEQRDSPQDQQETIDRLKRELTSENLAKANAANGRAIFAKACATCHRLFGTGGEIGPDLTGANRKNLDYLLSNIVDPSAVVTKDFLMTILTLDDGRVINGIAIAETESTVTVQTAQNKQVILLADIEERSASKLSLMPDGLLQPLSAAEIADLTAYLMSETQVELTAQR